MGSGCGYIEYFQSDDDELDYMIIVLLERFPIKSKQEIINIDEKVFDENRNM